MVRARCPFCGIVNGVGLLDPVNPGEPTPFDQTCEHQVYFSTTRYQGAQYVEQEMDVGLDAARAGYAFDAELLRLLNGYFRFVGPVAFAPSQEARDAAWRAVEDFLLARRIM